MTMTMIDDDDNAHDGHGDDDNDDGVHDYMGTDNDDEEDGRDDKDESE